MPEKQSIIEKFISQLKEPSDLLDGVKAELEARGDTPELSFSSLSELNDKMWGLRKGLTIVGGRTSQGKTSLVLQMAYDLADQNKEVLFLSLEMTVESIIERLFCNLKSVDNYDMLSGKLKTEQVYQERWGHFTKMMNIPLKIACGLGRSFNEINDLIDLLEPKPRVIVLDYIQAIRKGQNERADLDDYIIRFREICLLHHIAGVLVSQNSRKVFDDESKEPSLANLKSTGVLEESADTVLLVFWPHFYNKSMNKNIYKIIIAKQRNGRTGDYLVHYTPEYYRFRELALEEKTEMNKNKGMVTKAIDTFEGQVL